MTIQLVRSGATDTTVEIDFGDGATPVVLSAAPYANLTLGVGKNAREMAFGDVNGDNRTDLIVGDSTANSVEIYTNSNVAGTLNVGGFALAATIPAGSGTRGVAAADMDGDGLMDILAVNEIAGSVSVMRNISTNAGSSLEFDAKIDFPVGTTPRRLAVVDLDASGQPDLVVLNFGNQNASLYRNTGSPGSIALTAAGTIALGAGPSKVVVRDLDGDGAVDLTVLNAAVGNISVVRNQSILGSILFDTPTVLQAGLGVSDIAVADVNGDGKPDILMADNSGVLVRPNVSVTGSLLTTSFGTGVSVAAGGAVTQMIATDWDQDGRVDLLVEGAGGVLKGLRHVPTANMIGYDAPTNLVTGVGSLQSLALADLDGDAQGDVVRLADDSTTNVVSLTRNAQGQIGVSANFAGRRVVFGPGQTAITVGLRVVDDSLLNNNRNVNLQLGAASSAPFGTVAINPGTATLTILDNEIEIGFSSAGFAVSEGATNAVIEVTRQGVQTAPVSVNFSTVTGGTAVDGLNYNSTSALLNFAAGVNTQTVLVPIVDNFVTNPAWTVSLILSNAQGPVGTQLSTSAATLTINDDDPPQLAGSVDPRFDVTIDGPILALGVYTNLAQPALLGSLVIGGDFVSVGGVTRTRIARLDRLGNVDQSFGTTTGASDDVTSVAVQPDGKVLVAGLFTEFNQNSHGRLVRLNVDGTVDNTFNDGGSGFNSVVNAIALQPDGKLIVAGSFTEYNQANANFLVRLNPDGTRDTGFAIGLGPDAQVRSLALTGDGNLLIGGDFTSVTGVASRRLAKISTNGVVDISFAQNLGTGFDDRVLALAVQNTSVIVGGQFTKASGLTRQGCQSQPDRHG